MFTSRTDDSEKVSSSVTHESQSFECNFMGKVMNLFLNTDGYLRSMFFFPNVDDMVKE